jgi:hypothetical protein
MVSGFDFVGDSRQFRYLVGTKWDLVLGIVEDGVRDDVDNPPLDAQCAARPFP